ncbi:hypothetical protein SDC9_78311 [bioreactor metagenome]|uniref:Uncharacterized protein n=1 Tax=bioreactor metagenome TaxID=1076179 RepID=A0A644Z0N4_9ZZZZ
MRQLNGKRKQRTSAHIHFIARQFVSRDADREGVGELEPELNAFAFGKRDKSLEHRNCVAILQIVVEMKIVERQIVVAHVVHGLPRELVAKKRGVALNERIESLDLN